MSVFVRKLGFNIRHLSAIKKGKMSNSPLVLASYRKGLKGQKRLAQLGIQSGNSCVIAKAIPKI